MVFCAAVGFIITLLALFTKINTESKACTFFLIVLFIDRGFILCIADFINYLWPKKKNCVFPVSRPTLFLMH